jgi:hypothetical protein
MRQYSIVITALLFGKEYVDANQMNNQDRLELD